MNVILIEDGEVIDTSSVGDMVNAPNVSDINVNDVPTEVNVRVDPPKPASPPNNNGVLPPPPRSNYDYHIVPYYIPVGTNPSFYAGYRRGYRDMMRVAPSDFYGGKNFIEREYEEGEFDFTNDEPGLFCRQGNISISAGSETGRKDIIKVKIGRDKFYKTFSTPTRAKKTFVELVDVLYYDRDYFSTFLLKKHFKERD